MMPSSPGNRTWRIAVSVISYAMFLLLLILCAVPLLLCAAVPACWRYQNPFFVMLKWLIYRAMMFLSFCSLRVVGKEHLPKQPAVLVANHQSYLDVSFVGHLMGLHPHVWLAKTDFAKLSPFKKIVARLTSVVDMSTPQRGMRSLLRAVSLVRTTGSHLMIFPEGMRHGDGEIHMFYAGFAVAARMLDRPVIPVYLHGLNNVLPPRSYLLSPQRVHMVVGPAFTLQEGETNQQFVERVRAWFIQMS